MNQGEEGVGCSLQGIRMGDGEAYSVACATVPARGCSWQVVVRVVGMGGRRAQAKALRQR